MISRRHTVSSLGARALAALAPQISLDQGKTLKILVGYLAGGAVDVIARRVGEELRGQGYNATAENRTGAAGQLTNRAVANGS